MSETEAQGSIVNGLRRRKCLVLVLSGVPKAFPHLRGLPDLYVLTPNGDSWWVEVKSERGTPSPAQRVFEANVARRGGNYVVVRGLAEAVSGLGLD